MHRNRSRFATRVNRVASALERRGIKATYVLHDRVLSNRSSRRRFSHEPPRLDEVQQRIVSDLERDGFSLLTFGELFQDDAVWKSLDEQAAKFIADTEHALTEKREALRVRAGKEFVIRLHSYGHEVGFDDPWFGVSTSRRMLEIANSYLRLWSKLEYVDLWYSVPHPAGARRSSSQRWHRDFNDRRLVKAFLYLVDVDETNGPFEYVPGSAPGGPFSDAWPWAPLGETYPPENEVESKVAAHGARVFTGAKGTLLFCNTAGFHRGGFAQSKARVLATATYSSPASLASLTDRSYVFSSSPNGLDAPTRFALT